MSRIKSEGLSVSSVMGRCQAIGERSHRQLLRGCEDRVAHTSTVLASASRDRELFCAPFLLMRNEIHEKSVSARRRNQHAGRVRSSDSAYSLSGATVIILNIDCEKYANDRALYTPRSRKLVCRCRRPRPTYSARRFRRSGRAFALAANAKCG